MNQDLKKKYPPLAESEVDVRTAKAIDLYKKIAREAKIKKWEVVFLSGFAIDAHFGYLTRQHKDVDLMAKAPVVEEIRLFLEKEGHVVYNRGEILGECLKVDQVSPDKPKHSHCDIKYFTEDEEGRVVMSLDGRVIKLSAGVYESSEELIFLGETGNFLKLKYLLEEKDGWHNAGLKVHDSALQDMQKIRDLQEA